LIKKEMMVGKIETRGAVGRFVVFSFVAVLVLLVVVFAAVVEISTTAGNVTRVNDDITFFVNISVNNTYADGPGVNISEVNILLPIGATLTFSTGADDTNSSIGTGFDFENSTNRLLNWSSPTKGQPVINTTGTSVAYFWFNFTANTTGRAALAQNITVLPFNITGAPDDGSVNITLFVNDTYAVATNGSGMDAEGANVTFFGVTNYTTGGNESDVFYNVSVSNRSGIIKMNSTNFSGDSLEFNWSLEGLNNFTLYVDGVYFFNITANNSLLDLPSSVVGRKIIRDRTAPIVSLAQNNGSGGTTKNQIVVDITVTEALTGVSGLCSVDSTGASVTGSNLSQTLTDIGLSCGTKRSYTVTCSDYAGNNGVTVATTFATSPCDGGGGSAGGGGSSSGSPSGTVWSNTFADDGSELGVLGSVNRQLRERHRVRVMINGQKHHVGVIKGGLTSSTASIEVSSATRQATLGIGQAEKFEVNDDNFYDLKVTLNSIANNKADLTIVSVHEEVAEVTEERPSGRDTGVVGEGVQNVAEAVGASTGVIWIIVVIIIVIIIVVIVFVRKKNRK
jgi:hypothetical protein